MTLGRLGVWYSTDKLNGSQLADFVGVVEKSGYSALWYPESRGYELMSLAGYLLSKSTKLTIGSSIANIYARDSFTARRAMVSLNDLYQQPLHPGPGRQPHSDGRGPARPSLRQAAVGHARPISTASTRICRRARRRR